MVKAATAIKHSFMPGDCGYQYSNREKKNLYPYFKTNDSFKTAFPQLLRTVIYDSD